MARPKTKISILGGGIGSLVAAYELTNEFHLRERYDITVYQMGWRLGGKGASGRNLDDSKADRIEEHGLHFWFGVYENAFRMMTRCYDDLNRPLGAKLSRCLEGPNPAFKPHDQLTMMEQVRGQWVPWSLCFPRTGEQPGEGGYCLSVRTIIRRLLKMMLDEVRGEAFAAGEAERMPPVEHLEQAWETIEALDEHEAVVPPMHRRAYRAIADHVDQFGEGFFEANDPVKIARDGIRRMLILLNLGYAVVRGLIRDIVLPGRSSLDYLDRWDFREWLQRNRAGSWAYNSSPVRVVYELVFAYKGGDGTWPDMADLAAGVALRITLRINLAYQGALVYKMQAGMGDVVFAPLYLVLRNQRGVKFKFFHRVEHLGLADDGQTVGTIRLTQQVKLRDKKSEYYPLVDVKGLPCWPAEPLYEQINAKQVARLKQLKTEKNLDLESAWIDFPGTDVSLEAGRDFDSVVLGISVDAIRHVCGDLMAANSDFAEMVQNLKTVQTQSFQLWLNRTIDEMGWDAGDGVCRPEQEAVTDSYRNSWCDFSHLLPFENWDPDEVKNLAYFSKTLKDAAEIPAPGTDPDFPAEQHQRVKDLSLEFLTTGGTQPLWPRAADSSAPEQLDWNLLVDRGNGTGVDRFDSQFWIANINPTNRYVQSVKGSTQYRRKADQSGFENLILAGDWLRTGLNVGAIEGATMGGMQAARAICGSPQHIFGETDSCSGRAEAFSSAARTPSPTYIEFDGKQCYPQPVLLERARMTTFLVAADPSTLRQLCNHRLNIISGDRLRYHPLVPRVMVAATSVRQARPVDPPESGYGYFPYNEIAFLVPVVRLKRIGGLVWVPTGVLFFQPYLFLDNAWALTSGREIWGFDKAMADVLVPAQNSASAEFAADALAIKRFSTNSKAIVQRVLTVERRGEPKQLVLRQKWRRARSMHQHIVQTLADDEQGWLELPELGTPLNLFSWLDSLDVPMVFLRQYRDVADGRRASYQAIVESQATVHKFRSGGVLDGTYGLKLAALASHPIAQQLGLKASQRVKAAWQIDVDFVMENGAEVVKTSS